MRAGRARVGYCLWDAQRTFGKNARLLILGGGARPSAPRAANDRPQRCLRGCSVRRVFLLHWAVVQGLLLHRQGSCLHFVPRAVTREGNTIKTRQTDNDAGADELFGGCKLTKFSAQQVSTARNRAHAR